MFKKINYIIILSLVCTTINAQEWKKHYNSKENFNIEYPKTWVISKSNEIADQAFFVHEPFKDKMNILSNVQIKISSNFEIPLDIRADLKENEWTKSKTYNEYNITSRQKITFNKKNAYIYNCEAIVQEIPIKWICVIVIYNDKYIEISATTSKQKYTIQKGIFEKIIHSIVLNN